jgi:hypothetical protein
MYRTSVALYGLEVRAPVNPNLRDSLYKLQWFFFKLIPDKASHGRKYQYTKIYLEEAISQTILIILDESFYILDKIMKMRIFTNLPGY